MPPINPIRPPTGVAPLPSVTPAKTGGSSGFQSLLTDAMARVDSFQKNSDSVTERFLSGEDVEVHTVAMAQQEAEIHFQLFLQIRNKVVSAYQEVMRMQM